MLSLELFLLSTSALSVYGSAHHEDFVPRFDRHFHPRNYVTPSTRSSSYDYVIVGGGLAGLVVASRLSDDPSKSVLVLEAGPSGDAVANQLATPSSTYFNSLLNASPYDWLYKTVPQANANSRAMVQPRGRVLGGSSAVNGMYMLRPPSQQVNAWRDLIAPSDAAAAEKWGWDSFYAALKRTENFTEPTTDAVQVAGMAYTLASHNTTGSLHVTYPGYMVPVTGTWLPALEAAGIAKTDDAYAGNNLGGFFALTAMNAANWTRSYSKSAYIDVLPPRSNLHIMSDATVERILFSDAPSNGNLVANTVQFSTGVGTTVQNVAVNKEVLMAGGAYGSAHILQLSGVGPKDVLDAVDIPVKIELDGVGSHMTDHLSAGVFWNSKVDTQGSIMASGSDFSKTALFNGFVNSGTAYVNGSRLFNGDESFATFVSGIDDSTKASATLAPTKSDAGIAGYKTIYDTVLQKFYPTSGLVEILFSINAGKQIAVQAALQLPLSQGRQTLQSSSVYDAPLIDPNYFSHPADVVVLRQGIKLARQIGTMAPLADNLADEVSPGPSVATDADIETWLRNSANTEFHPSGACAMLPREQGGVVDANLKVYGTANVRVVDSSVFPTPQTAHLMAPTYALGEMAASIVAAADAGLSSTPTTSGSGSSPATTVTGTTPATQSSKSGARSLMQVSSWSLLSLAGVVVCFL
ncbi:hypothetical protein D9619_004034 [Psilocybe cf. subviscida]|uniref:pyranose dehydrogenase (acceptor) n=1 Tax=Psilocybe cf. subviscida TaxID=2480587 RepID=A0A8H5F866_9AGAR|nr:hypothetical protein D9619_004034 [Psilocybe cf. subviscida]